MGSISTSQPPFTVPGAGAGMGMVLPENFPAVQFLCILQYHLVALCDCQPLTSSVGVYRSKIQTLRTPEGTDGIIRVLLSAVGDVLILFWD